MKFRLFASGTKLLALGFVLLLFTGCSKTVDPRQSATSAEVSGTPVVIVAQPPTLSPTPTQAPEMIIDEDGDITLRSDIVAQFSASSFQFDHKPVVLIYHTHATESYLQTEAGSYVETEPGRTENTKYNVVAVGNALQKALEARGFEVTTAGSVSEATDALKIRQPAFAVLDMRLEDGNGLKIVEAVREKRQDARIVMLTGYGAIATAVAAVKAGAVDYMQKPADADDVVKALLSVGEAPEPPENPMSADRVRWEHIQRVYELCDHNVSETARRLGMHRRTLQRILAKRAPR